MLVVKHGALSQIMWLACGLECMQEEIRIGLHKLGGKLVYTPVLSARLAYCRSMNKTFKINVAELPTASVNKMSLGTINGASKVAVYYKI